MDMFTMSGEARRRNVLGLMPAVILVTVVAVGLGTGYYLASVQASTPAVAWSVNPLFITFSSQTGSGSTSDSFTCSPVVAPVTLQAISSQPSTITLTANPSSFARCGSLPDSVVVTAACTTTAQANGTCAGDFSGKVKVCGPTPYTCLQRTLNVVITVSNNQQQ